VNQVACLRDRRIEALIFLQKMIHEDDFLKEGSLNRENLKAIGHGLLISRLAEIATKKRAAANALKNAGL
jgi:adenine deaminase